MKKVVITGATGLIGKNLVEKLKKEGYYVIVFSRDEENAKNKLPDADEFIRFPEGSTWKEKVTEADCIINLAGENIASGRWTQRKKEKLRSSRIGTTNKLVEVIKGSANKPGVFISASAVGYYGYSESEEFTEDSPAGTGFLAELTHKWENEANKIEGGETRVVIPRIGVVLSGEGGALKKMLPAFKLFLGGPIGNGRQWFPWIHTDDLTGIILKMIEDETMEGVYNAVAPEYVKAGDFARALGKVLKRPALFPVPVFALRLLFGEGAESMSKGQKVIPERLVESGYKFKFEKLSRSLQDILRSD